MPRPTQIAVRPAIGVIAGREDRILDVGLRASGLALPRDLQVIQPPNEQQVGDLLHHLQRIGDAACPERILDAIDLALQLPGEHARQAIRWALLGV